jgi:hypothetical protein
MTTTLFWDFTHCRMVVCYCCFRISWTPWPLMIGPISCLTTPATNYHSMLRKIPEEYISHLLSTDYRLLSTTWLSHTCAKFGLYIYIYTHTHTYIYISERRTEIKNIKKWHADMCKLPERGKVMQQGARKLDKEAQVN